MLAGLLLWLLIGPRIELPGLHGMRVEDVVFGALAVLCLAHRRGLGRPAGPTLAVIGVAVTGLISAVVDTARGMVDPVSSVLFAVRPLEYWIAFPAALLLLRSPDGRWLRRIDGLLVIVTVLQTAFAVLQYYFGLPIGFSHAAYTRAAGLTVGPYELGAMSAALVVYWIAHGRWAMASLSSIALAASISRISILGGTVAVAVLVVAWAIRLIRDARARGWRAAIQVHRRSRPLAVGQALSVVAAALVLGFTVGLIHLPAFPIAVQSQQVAGSGVPAQSPTPTEDPSSAAPGDSAPAASDGPQAPSESIAERLESTSVLGSWNAADGIAAKVPHSQTSAEYQYAAYGGLNVYLNVNTASDSGAEPSNLIRFYRWHLILDTFDDPVDVIFGLGPSFVGPSVDGSYLRFFADGGILGVLAWLVLIVMWLRRTPLWMVCVTLSMLIGALFIDIVYSERPMVLFWMLLALAFTRPGRRTSASDVEPSRI